LEAYESVIHTEATSTWQSLHTSAIYAITDNRVTFEIKNDTYYSEFMRRENALSYVANNEWETLKRVKFEEATVEVPVLDTFQRTPSIRENSTVKVYVYDRTKMELSPLFGNAIVENAIYLEADFGATGTQAWENIKGAAAGFPGYTVWTGFGEAVMSGALEANIVSSYTIPVIYVIEVSDGAGELIAQYEFHQTATKDIILILSA
jgi:hypothetical protein